MNKICSKCKIKKSLDQFRKGNGSLKVCNWCKECIKSYEQSPIRKEIMKQYRKSNKYKKFIKNYRKSLKGIYSYIKGEAKARNIFFNLTENIFIKWYQNQTRVCTYCSRTEKEAIKDRKGRIFRLTIDRKDNNKGYISGNLTLCCHKCNEIKSGIFTFNEMIRIGDVLKTIYKEKTE